MCIYYNFNGLLSETTIKYPDNNSYVITLTVPLTMIIRELEGVTLLTADSTT